MKKHKYLGKVQSDDLIGFVTEKKFQIPHFAKNKINVYFGEEFVGIDGETDNEPNQQELDMHEKTFTNFLKNIDSIVAEIKKKTFERYLKIYAHYYENKKKSGNEPLGIDSAEKHFDYLKDMNYIRIFKGDVLKILIFYKLDKEHGLEIKLKKNKVVDIAGISET